MNWKVVREIQVCRADAAGQGPAERSLQSSSTERKERFGIRIEEAGRDFVLPTVDFPVPVGGELILCVLPRLIQD